MARDITAPAHAVTALVDIRCGSEIEKHYSRQVRRSSGLFLVHFGPVYDQNCSFSYSSHVWKKRKHKKEKHHGFESWETKFGMVVLH